MAGSIGRRAFLKAAGSLGLLGFAAPGRLEALLATAPGPGQPGRFLSAHELDTMRAVCGRFVPGPPDDPDPGAVEAGAAEAIDLLLAAFTFEPPLIHAGGPFSNRAGATHDDFADFIPLDPLAALGWRIRIEGSQGRPEREFAGPVDGLQQAYRKGLAHLDERAGQVVPGATFVMLPGPVQDLILSDQTDGDVQDFVSTALSDTVDAVYGPPEYGGNRNLVGWTVNHWPGDTQPRGYTDAQVSRPDPQPTTPPLATKAAKDALERFLPALAGRAAPRRAPWLGRAGYERG